MKTAPANNVTISNSTISDSVLNITQSAGTSPTVKDIALGLKEILELSSIKALPEPDRLEVEDLAGATLTELSKPSPDIARVKRGLTRLWKFTQTVGEGVASKIAAELIVKASGAGG
ncbi:hypothetical protein DC522_17235 [Microvirga sp. KLBC 81]|uniref:hypothetical protein n=1 Tax=Microvirga sp. KLBC 81 TaxID=1862707 RepID=UPI000D5251F6|nr:hypothetical protein [Microvirga sp. KLBC 81]PVE23223.1 hypothetical protein DC522_17235 [Microvirga sp. KLBC 81]